MTKGKIVLVPFPFDDLSSSKVRPAVCLTNPIGLHRHVVVAFISSQAPSQSLDSDVILGAQRLDFRATGLRVSSVLRLHRLVTLSTSLIVRELGALSPTWLQEVERKLTMLFGLTKV
jgi:mRNA interferase MazF